MKATTKFKIVTLGALVSYSAAIWGSGFWGGYSTGYAAGIEDVAKEENCLRMLAPVKKDFERGCSKKTADTLYNGSLNPILHQRDEIIEKYKCSEETWMCEPTLPSDLQNSDFKAVYHR